MSQQQQTKTFRGRSLEELLPRIRTELGEDAIVTRQREGLMGGVGGFFQKRFVEVEAAPGGARFDAYDEPPAADPPPFIADVYRAGDHDPAIASGLESPVMQAMISQAAPFATQLDAAVHRSAAARAAAEADGALALAPELEQEPEAEPRPELSLVPEPEPEPVPAPALEIAAAPAGRLSRPPSAETLERTLAEHGLSEELAGAVVAEALSHALPFAVPQQLKRLVRQGLARRVPGPAPRRAGGLVLAFAGPGGAGKTLACASLARAYAEGSDRPVAVVALRPRDGGAELRALLAPAGVEPTIAATAREAAAAVEELRSEAVVVLDTPAVSPAQEAAVRALGSELRRLKADEVHLLVPATTSGPAARGMVERLGALRATGLVVAHADETDHLGGALELAIDLGTPLSYVLDAAGLAPADPLALANRVLP